MVKQSLKSKTQETKSLKSKTQETTKETTKRKTLYKIQLIRMISQHTGKSLSDTNSTINAFITIMKDSLLNDNRISIIGLGSFVVKDRKARLGVNPKTKAAISIPSSKAVSFKMGSSFKKAVQSIATNPKT